MESNQKDLIEHLIAQNLLLQAQFTSLKGVVQALFVNSFHDQDNYEEIAQKFSAQYLSTVRAAYQQAIADHPLMEASWKKMMKEELGDIPGLDLNL